MISLPLLGRTGPPSFAEPWHAQAFAAAVTLSHAGCFTWTEWVSAFAAEIAHARRNARAKTVRPPTFGSGFRRSKGCSPSGVLMTAEEIGGTAEDWRRSYLRTPHGKPVNLRRNLPDIAMPEGDDHHHHERTTSAAPITIDPGRRRINRTHRRRVGCESE